MGHAATDIRGYLADETSQVDRKRILVAEHCGQAERLTQLLWDTWRAIEPGLGANPVVLHLDFAGIGELSDAISGDCLPYFLGGVLLGVRPCYVIWDNLSPGVFAIVQSMFHEAGRYGVGRRAGQSYRLLGSRAERQTAVDYEKLWDRMNAEKAWVNGASFERTVLGPKSRGKLLRDMYNDGTAIRACNGQPNYLTLLP
jgi:hypothetical protein